MNPSPRPTLPTFHIFCFPWKTTVIIFFVPRVSVTTQSQILGHLSTPALPFYPCQVLDHLGLLSDTALRVPAVLQSGHSPHTHCPSLYWAPPLESPLELLLSPEAVLSSFLVFWLMLVDDLWHDGALSWAVT